MLRQPVQTRDRTRYPHKMSPAEANHKSKFKSRSLTHDVISHVNGHQTMGLLPIVSLLDDKTKIQELKILSSENRDNISQQTLDKASMLGIEVFTQGEWTNLFCSLHYIWFGPDNIKLAINNDYKKHLKAILSKLSQSCSSVGYVNSQLKWYNEIRCLYDNADYMPEIVAVAAVPDDLKASGVCNIYNKIFHYEAKLAKKSKIPTINVLEKLPTTDDLGLNFKESVDVLSEDFKKALIADPKTALENPEIQQNLLHITPEDITSDKKTIVMCNCGISFGDLKLHLENITTEILGINKTIFETIDVIENMHKCLEIKCIEFQCKRKIPWRKLVTLYYQYLSASGHKVNEDDKQFIKTIEAKYALQALRSGCPEKLKFCKNEDCPGKEGMLIMNKFKLHKIECIHCYSLICTVCDLQGDDYHYNQPCLGYLKTQMDDATIASLQALGMQMCPGCKTGVLKTEFCDHMTCPTPGCGTHFCYRCGASISALGMYTHQCPILQQAIGILELEGQNHI
jgi:hypothetical protein